MQLNGYEKGKYEMLIIKIPQIQNDNSFWLYYSPLQTTSLPRPFPIHPLTVKGHCFAHCPKRLFQVMEEIATEETYKQDKFSNASLRYYSGQNEQK